MDSIFSTLVYVNVSSSLDLGTIQLRRKADFHLKIIKISSTNDTLSWKLSYSQPYCRYVFENEMISKKESSCYETFVDQHYKKQTPNSPNLERKYHTVIGGKVKFTYRINNNPEQSILLNINETEEYYVFEY